MTSDEMQERTVEFGSRILRLADALPNTNSGRSISNQIVRSGISIGANYREALHASSARHFVTIMEVAQREANETLYWIELVARSELLKREQLQALEQECREIYAILTATIVTKKKNMSATSTG